MLELRVNAESVARAAVLLGQAPERLKAELHVAMLSSSASVLGRLKDRVHVVTGTLRRSWALRPVVTGSDGVGARGGVGSNLAYAAAEEFGFSGPVQVRAHQRRTEHGSVTVRAHRRQARHPEHPYARPAMADSGSDILRYHEAAIARAWKAMQDANG